jgi:hypothetical protein
MNGRVSMSESKPFASLSSGLLARKGAAKPAMRPQGFGQMGAGIEDLGWNDMGGAPPIAATAIAPVGDELREHVPSSIAALTPAPRSHDRGADEAAEVPQHPIAEQQRTIAATFATETEIDEPSDELAESAPVVALPRRPRTAPGAKGKAAFTLRLDPDRHLKLRLACAIRHRSAQQIVSEALDKFLLSLPELATLTDQLPAKAAKSN